MKEAKADAEQLYCLLQPLSRLCPDQLEELAMLPQTP